MRHKAGLRLTLFAMICGCGGSSSGGAQDAGVDVEEPDAYVFVPGNHVANPTPAPGGGVGSGAIDGEINVFVIDAVTREPIEGAEVRIGDADATSPLGDSTDADGLVVFQGEGLSGAQSVTASADDHAATTWIGANGAVITLPLEPTVAPTPPTATVSGTVPGWEDISLGAGEYLFAAIAYSLSDNENNLVDQGGAPGNSCFRVPGFVDGPCAWTLITRTGPLAIYALIYLADDNGTPFDFSDDTYAFYGYALQTGFDLAESDVLADQTLPLLADTDLVTTQVTYGTLPIGLAEVQWLAMLELGDEGNVALPATPGTPTLDVPALAGALASDSYRMVAFAQPSAMVDTPQSGILHRTTAVEGTVDIGSWLPMPYGLAEMDGTYSFTAATGATIHAVEFTSTADGTRVWSVLPLDGSTSFRLPVLDPAPLSGDTDMTVRAYNLDSFDPTAFALDSLIDQITRTSSDRITFTP